MIRKVTCLSERATHIDNDIVLDLLHATVNIMRTIAMSTHIRDMVFCFDLLSKSVKTQP